MNPFTSPYQTRNNYPGLDDAFQINSSVVSGVNLSPCSPDRSSIAAPSDLNMSIGARAAIYEHTRYISKYGLDADSPSPLKTSSSSPSFPSSRQSQYAHDGDEWDRIMDGVACNTSIVAESLVSTSLSLHHGNCSYLDISLNRALDTTALSENQSDFFNSSRVMQYLATPEKNKEKVDEASRLARLGVGVMSRHDGKDDIIYPFSPHYEGDDAAAVRAGATDVSMSTDLEQSGMIGLFQAALKFEKECLLHAKQDDHDYEEEEGDLDDHDAACESFVSYHEPNMSIMDIQHKSLSNENVEVNLEHDEQFYDEENITDHGIDANNSFVSYHEPDLTVLLSTNCEEEINCCSRSPSDFGQSEFNVDVSEIIAPSEFESKFATMPYVTRLGQLLDDDKSAKGQVLGEEMSKVVDAKPVESPFSSCSSPMVHNDPRKQNHKQANPELTPPSPSSPLSHYHIKNHEDCQVHPSQTEAQSLMQQQHRETLHRSSPLRINRSLIHHFECTKDNEIHERSVKSCETPAEPERNVTIECQGVNIYGKRVPKQLNPTIHSSKSSTFVLAPAKTGRYSNKISIPSDKETPLATVDAVSHKMGMRMKYERSEMQYFHNLSPLSPPRSRTSVSQGSSLIASSGTKSTRSALPQRMSLRERYSCRDRFEDSFTIPSSYAGSTFSSTPHTCSSNEVGSISNIKSPMVTFETDFDSPNITGYSSSRRFAV